MMKTMLMPKVTAAIAFGAVLLGAGSLSAAPCPTDKVLYVTGSTAAQPFIQALAAKLGGTINIVYQGGGSCVGVNAAVSGTKLTGNATIWDAAGTASSCELPTAPTVGADVGVSDVFASTCEGVAALPATVGDFFGPVQVMNFIVPVASSQVSLSSDAGYLTYGFGAAGEVSPFTNDALIFQRNASSGTQAMLALAIGVPPGRWKATTTTGSGDILAKVSASATPEATIGILASDFADKSRDKVKRLAFQADLQLDAYWPDSKATSFDKINVRDGHYVNWGPLHLFTAIDGAKNPTNAAAAKLTGYFTEKEAPPAGVNLIDLEIAAYTVPQCAMKVTRTKELGDFSDYTPAKPCGCYFEFKATGATSCKMCAADSECGGKKCSYGYCEGA